VSSGSDGILRRHFLSIATSRYTDDTWSDLPGVTEELRVLRRWLCSSKLGDRAFSVSSPELADNPTKSQIRYVLEEQGLGWNESDAAVVFITGHGYTLHNTHWLVLKDTGGPGDVDIRSADILRWLARTRVKHLLVIFDLCDAGSTAYDSLRLDSPFPSSWVVLASTGVDQKAQTGALTTAIAEFLRDLERPEGERFNHGPYLHVGDFLSEVQAKLAPSGQSLSYVRPEIPVLNQSTPCLPNPRWRPATVTAVQRPRSDLAIRAEDLSAHWDPKARGVAETGERGWLFSGRHSLMRRLVGFTAEPPKTLLVTGSAGCGKSAALARLVTLSDPDFVRKYAAKVAEIPAHLRPAEGAIDVAVRATGKLPHEVFQQICDAFNIRISARDLGSQSLDRLRQAWWTWLDDRTQPITLVVDALDEAAYPNSLLVDVLARLERPEATESRVRLLIGVRSPSDDEMVQERTRAALADRAQDLLNAERLRVDREPLWVPRDLHAYIVEILQSRPESPYHGDRSAASLVAEIISGKAGTSYLIAQLAAASLSRRTSRVDIADQNWLAALDAGVVGVFRDDLYANTTTTADRQRAVELLRAVAFAYGRGLPWHRVWPLVANAVSLNPTITYGDGDIAWLLNSRLGGYLITDQEDDTTVYRLFHDTLRTTLRDRWRALLHEDAPVAETELDSADTIDLEEPSEGIRATEEQIAYALRSLTKPQRTAELYAAPPPYVRRHLVEHAQAGGVLTEDVVSIAFLPFVDVSRLREVATGAGSIGGPGAEAMSVLPIVRKVSHLWDWARPGLNAAALELWASMLGVTVDQAGFGGSWTVAWATRTTDRSEIVGRHAGPTSSVGAAEVTSGRFVAVAGGSDGVIQLWDLTTGASFGEPFIGHTDWVGALVTTRLPDGSMLAITGSDDCTVRVWDLANGLPRYEPLRGHASAVRSVATTVLPDGKHVIISGSHDRTVRIWDLLQGTQIGPNLIGHTDKIHTVTTVAANGRVYAVSAGADSTIRVWDLVRQASVGKPFGGRNGPIFAAASAILPGGRPIVVTGGADTMLRRWDLTGAPYAGPLQGHLGMIGAIAVDDLPDGRIIVVSGDDNKTLRRWDLVAGKEIGDPLQGHTDRIHAVATVTLPGRQVVAITGSDDRTVRMWDLADQPVGTETLATPTDTIQAAATVLLPSSEVVLVTGGADRTVRMWDFSSGTAVGNPMTGHTGFIGALATVHLPGGRVAAVTAGADRTVRLWDLSSCSAIGRPMTGHKSMISTMATAMLPNGAAVAVTGSWDYTARIWDLASGEEVGRPLVHDGPVISSAVAKLIDGQVIVVTGTYDDGDLRIWDLATGELVARLATGHTNAIRAVATAGLPDGRSLAVTASADRTIRLFDLDSREAIGGPLLGHTGAVRAVATTTLHDGRRLAVSGSDDRTIRVWDLVGGLPVGDVLPTPNEVHVLTVHPQGGPRVIICGDRFLAAVDSTAGMW